MRFPTAVLALCLAAFPGTAEIQVFSAAGSGDSAHSFILGSGMNQPPPFPDSVSLTDWWVPLWGGESTGVTPPDTGDTADGLPPRLAAPAVPETLAVARPEFRFLVADTGAGVDTASVYAYFVAGSGPAVAGAGRWDPDSFVLDTGAGAPTVRQGVLWVSPLQSLANQARYSVFVQVRDRAGLPATWQDTFYLAK